MGQPGCIKHVIRKLSTCCCSQMVSTLKLILLDLKTYWRSLIIVLTPLILLPLPILKWESSEARCGYVLIIMAIYWMTEVVPLAVTAFLPIFMFPLFRVITVSQTCKNYLKDTNFLFFGGLMVAEAVQESHLHRRIALRIILLMGAKPEWLMCGFMLVTAFLSMWMSNTATTAMMIPIAVAVLLELQQDEENQKAIDSPDSASPCLPQTENQDNSKKRDEQKLKPTGVVKGVLLSIAYAANLGGSGTLTGTGPNLVFTGQLSTIYPGADTGITFASWMPFAIPNLCILLVLAWLLLQVGFFGRKSFLFTRCKASTTKEADARIKKMLRVKYEQMGPMTFAEKSVLFWFLLLVALWIFRDPKFIRGWGDLLGVNEGRWMADSSTAMFIGCILFAWPRQFPDFACLRKRDRTRGAVNRESLLTWERMTVSFPWAVIMLLGGGFALADGVKSSNLSTWLGCTLSEILSSLAPFSMLAIFTILITFLTEISSNTATASIFIPIMFSLAENLGKNPLMFALPATIAPSYAFMLPVATPPNAIVYQTGIVKIPDMMLVGFFMNWICIAVTLFTMSTYARALFPLDTYPDWAGTSNVSSCAGAISSPIAMILNATLTNSTTL